MITNSFLSYDNSLPYWRNFLIKSYYNLKLIGVREDVNFELDASNVIFERYPLAFEWANQVKLERI